ncbi:MAG: hypothetical protein AAFY88_24075, partial [Acidobacteriota bacterium]
TIFYRASSQLMQDVHFTSSLRVGAELTAVRNGAGEVELFFIDTGQAVARVRRRPESPSGWRQTTLECPFVPSRLRAAATAVGDVVLFVQGTDRNRPTFFVVALEAGDGAGPMPMQLVPQESLHGFELISYATYCVGDRVELFTVLAPPQHRDGFEQPYELWHIPWQSPRAAWRRLGPASSSMIELCCSRRWGPGIVSSVRNAASPNASDLVFRAAPFTAEEHVLATGVRFTESSTGLLDSGFSGLFLYDAEQPSLAFMDCGAEGAGFEPLSAIRASQVLAGEASDEELKLFLISENRLHLMRRRSVDGQWSKTAFPLATPAVRLAKAVGEGGYTSLLVQDDRGGLTLMSEPSNEDEGDFGSWKRESVALEVSGAALSSRYATDLQLFGQDQRPYAGKPVTLRSSLQTRVLVNGRSHVIGPELPLELMTDRRGKVRVSAVAQGMVAPRWQVASGGQPSAPSLGLHAGEAAQERLLDLAPE